MSGYRSIYVWGLLAVGVTLLSLNAGAQEKWYPSKHGAADTLGAINFLSPEKVVEAAKLVKTGKTYALGPEEHVLAAVVVFLDVVNLFLFILRLVGFGSRD